MVPRLMKGDFEYYGFIEVLPDKQGQFVTYTDKKNGESIERHLPFITRPNIQSKILDPYTPSGKARWVGRIELDKEGSPVMFIRHLRLLQRPPEQFARHHDSQDEDVYGEEKSFDSTLRDEEA